jgi:hypothetical protein
VSPSTETEDPNPSNAAPSLAVSLGFEKMSGSIVTGYTAVLSSTITDSGLSPFSDRRAGSARPVES